MHVKLVTRAMVWETVFCQASNQYAQMDIYREQMEFAFFLQQFATMDIKVMVMGIAYL
jgi:hypothetical protein